MKTQAINIEQVRQDTPASLGRLHFNNAGAALMPEPVLAAVIRHLNLEATMGGYEAANQEIGRLEAVYTSIAKLINFVTEYLVSPANRSSRSNKTPIIESKPRVGNEANFVKDVKVTAIDTAVKSIVAAGANPDANYVRITLLTILNFLAVNGKNFTSEGNASLAGDCIWLI